MNLAQTWGHSLNAGQVCGHAVKHSVIRSDGLPFQKLSIFNVHKLREWSIFDCLSSVNAKICWPSAQSPFCIELFFWKVSWEQVGQTVWLLHVPAVEIAFALTLSPCLYEALHMAHDIILLFGPSSCLLLTHCWELYRIKRVDFTFDMLTTISTPA